MSKKAKKKREPASGDVVTNRRARHKFEWVEKMEAGIVLQGSGGKALGDGDAQMTDAYAGVEGGGGWVRKLPIPPFEYSAGGAPPPERPPERLPDKGGGG